MLFSKTLISFAFAALAAGVAATEDQNTNNFLRRNLGNGPLKNIDSFPDKFGLPDGFRPEGVVAGKNKQIFVSCTRGEQVGSIWKGDIGTGEGEVLIAPTGDPTRGLSLDNQNRLWVAWLFGARVYDSESGELLKEYQFVTENAVINDVIVTDTKAIFTDSGSQVANGRGETGQPRLFIVDFDDSPGNSFPDSFSELTLDTTLNIDDGGPTLNGIETISDDSSIVVACHTKLGALLAIDLTTGVTTEVDVGEDEAFSTCDGLVRRGDVMYVVRNRDTKTSVVTLDPKAVSGTIDVVYDMAAIINDPDLDTPTTGALYGDYLYAPDSKFRLCGGSSTCDNTTPYSVYRIQV